MGAVYKARQPRLDRLVALKVMLGAPGREADFALRFEREAQLLARLNHPHIVTLHDFGEFTAERTGDAALFWFLMEYVDGTDLCRLIHSKELKPTEALAIVPQICEALQYAHDQGITHRDIKPANILIDQRGVVKIADFGLAKMIGGGTEEALMTGLTQTGWSMGTPHYMAPEQWEHPDQVDHRADIYALGVVFYEMLTGERPAGVFEPPSRKSSPPVDKKLDGVVMRAMEKNPERRYQQAAQIGEDVTRISGANKRNGSPRPTAQPRRPLKSLLALVVVASLVAGGWELWSPSKGKIGEVETRPASPSAPEPAPEWVKVDFASIRPPENDPRLTLREGRLHLRVGGWAPLGSKTFRQVAHRASFIWPGEVEWVKLLFIPTAPSAHRAEFYAKLGTAQVGGQYWSIGRYQGNDASFTGSGHFVKPPLKPGDAAVFQFAFVDGTFYAWVNGQLMGAVRQSANLFAEGCELKVTAQDLAFDSYEYLSLDGLSEVDALKVLGVEEPVPLIAAEGSPGDSPDTEAWQDLLSDADALQLMEGSTLTNGKLNLPARSGGAIATASNQKEKPRDGAVRMRVIFTPGQPQPSLIARQTPNNARYSAILRGGNHVEVHRVSEENEQILIADFPVPAPLAEGDQYELELRTVGPRIEIRWNGANLGGVDDSSVSRGWFGLRQFGDTNVTADALEYLPLDRISEDEVTSPGVSNALSGETSLPLFTDREAAEWALDYISGIDTTLGGTMTGIRVRTADKPEKHISSRAELPTEPFSLTAIHCLPSDEQKSNAAILGRITDAEVIRLLALKELRELRLHGSLTGRSLAAVLQIPALEVLTLSSAQFGPADLELLKDCKLHELTFLDFRLRDTVDLEVFRTMPALQLLSFNLGADTDLVAALPSLPKLKKLGITSSPELTDEALPMLVERFPALELVNLARCGNLHGTRLGALKELPNLELIELTDTAVDDAALSLLTGLNLPRLILRSTRITDASIPLLNSLPLVELDLGNTRITDAGITQMVESRTLKRLSLMSYRSAGFTGEGIAAFETRRPDVQVSK